MSIAKNLCCPRIIESEPPYRSPKEENIEKAKEIWLDTNELPYPFANFHVDSSNYHLYPEFQDSGLRRDYADYASVDPDEIAIVRGADEAIELMIRAFCVPGKDRIIDIPPTYSMYHLTANMLDIGVVPVPRLANFDVDVEGLKGHENVKLIFICTPNNPTGNLLERQHLIELLEHYKDKSIIVIDEAYIEFCPEFACEQLISDYPNLAVIRTLSKAFGLAALRCGFLLAGRDIIDIVHRVMAPYPLAEPITQIARQALTNSGLRRMEQSVERITNASNKFCEELAKLDCVTEVIPGLGNFVLVKFKDASVDLSLLLKNGINIRDVVTGFGITHLHKRISIGTDEQMELLMTVLEKINANYVSKVSPAIADEVSFG